MDTESFRLVRRVGEATVHILVGGDGAAGEDDSWDVAMCGESLGDDRTPFATLEHGTTVGDTCLGCFVGFGTLRADEARRPGRAAR